MLEWAGKGWRYRVNRKMPITVIEGESTQKGQFPKETIESQTISSGIR